MSARGRKDALETAREFVGRAPVYMCLLDLDLRRIAISECFFEKFTKPLGLTMESLIGQRIGDYSEHAKAGMLAMQRTLDAGGVHVAEHEYVGGVFLRSMANYWRGDDGEPLAILLTYTDVTAEKHAEMARREYEAQLQAVVDHLPAQISLMNLDTGCVELMNDRVRTDSVGLVQADSGQSFRERISPRQLETLNESVARAEANGGYNEHEHVMPAGPMAGRTMRLKHVLFTDARGQRKLLWIAEDVTALKEATLALQQAAAEAEAANRAKSEFLTNMSHEIRTPLNGVMGVAGALARTPLTPPQQEMVALIETSARTLETLLSDILDLARIEAGKMELRPEPFDPAASVRACAALFDAAAQTKGLDLEVHVDAAAEGPHLGDPVRVRQVVSNLLGNAVKFTQKGFVRLTVTAEPRPDATAFVFQVRDTGIGFDAETKARLFSRFEQADGSITRKFGGTGLGLAISRSLAAAMGGRLEADAAPGEGAVFTFTVELPRCEAAVAGPHAGDDGAQADASLETMRVLLAEDHVTNRRVVELILGAAGVDLTCVENGAEAVEAFRDGDFDLVLMDMQMPVMDGLTAIGEIRRLEAAEGRRRTPIQVLTANAMPEHVAASLSAGADGHLSKPILADALLQKVAETAAAQCARDAPLRARAAG